MADARETSDGKAKSKSSRNWPVMVAGALCVAFIVGVWVNNYRVSHAAPVPAPIAAPK